MNNNHKIFLVFKFCSNENYVVNKITYNRNIKINLKLPLNFDFIFSIVVYFIKPEFDCFLLDLAVLNLKI